MTPADLLAVRAESLYEELGGDMCSCQNVDCPHWCEKCQQRIAYILTVFQRLREEGRTDPLLQMCKGYVLESMASALEQYVEWHGSVHVGGCPADDTCECSWKPVNDGINMACRFLRAMESATSAGAVDPVGELAKPDPTTRV